MQKKNSCFWAHTELERPSFKTSVNNLITKCFGMIKRNVQQNSMFVVRSHEREKKDFNAPINGKTGQSFGK